MNRRAGVAAAEDSDAWVVQAIVQLAREASIEIGVEDVRHLEASRALLAPGTKVYVNHLPKQTWRETEAACSRSASCRIPACSASAGTPDRR